MFARTALGAFCATALVAGGVSPTMASDWDKDKNHDELKVTVCKKVKDRGKDDGDHDKRFDFEAWTDKDETDFRLGDDDCKKFHLDFDDNKFKLEEDWEKDYDVDFKVRGDDEEVKYRKGKLWVKFDDSEDKPHLKITVTNKKDKDDHRGWGH